MTNFKFDKKTILKNIQIFVFSGLTYFAMQYIVYTLSNDLIINIPQLQVSVLMVLSILNGWPAILGCGAGAFIKVATNPNSQFSAIGTALIAMLLGYIVWKLWAIFSKTETNIFRMDSYKRLLRYALVVLVAAVIGGSLITLASYRSVRLESYSLAAKYLMNIADIFEAGMVYGLPLITAISMHVAKFKDPEHKLRKFHASEKIIFVCFIISLVCVLLVTGSVMGRMLDYYGIEASVNTAYFSCKIFVALIIVGELFIAGSAIDREAFTKAVEKVALFITLMFVILNGYMAYQTQTNSTVLAYVMNDTIYAVGQCFCATMFFASLLDRHSVDRQTFLFLSVTFVASLHLFISGYEYYLRAIENNVSVVQYLEGAAYLFECIEIVMFLSLIIETLEITDRRYKILMWGFRVGLIGAGIFQFSGVIQGELSHLDETGQHMLEYVPDYFIWVETVAFLICIYVIIKNRRQPSETVSFCALIGFGLFNVFLTIAYTDIYFFPTSNVIGLIACFNSIYIKRSNRLNDTQKDLDFAANIQLSMLPKDFTSHNFSEIDLYASMNPAKDVGGDFYDFYRVSDKHIVIVIADVSGKGMPAAMVMMRAITAIKNFAMAGLPVDKLTEMASNNVNEHNDAMLFITAWIGLFNVKTGKLRFVNAGHNPPLLRHKDGRVEEIITKPDMIMGFFPGAKYVKRQMQLEEGDTIFLYTDGINEALSDYEEQYGMERLHKAVAQPMVDARELCKRVKADVDKFVGPAPQFDDMTMLAMTYTNKKREAAASLHPDLAAGIAEFNSGDGFEESIGLGPIELEPLDPNGIIMSEEDGAAPLDIEILSTDSPLDIDSNIVHLSESESAAPLDIEILGGEEPGMAGRIKLEPIVLEQSTSSIDIDSGTIHIEESESDAPLEIEVVDTDVPIDIEIIGNDASLNPLDKDYSDIQIQRKQPDEGLAKDEDELEAQIITVETIKTNVSIVTDQLDKYLESAGCETEDQVKIDIAFDEVFSNIVNYAYEDNKGTCTIEFKKLFAPRGINISFIDVGSPYNPLIKDDPDPIRSLEDRSHGGMGIFIVKKTMDEVFYERRNDKNCFTMVKYF